MMERKLRKMKIEKTYKVFSIFEGKENLRNEEVKNRWKRKI
jgi:hypothetical protein